MTNASSDPIALVPVLAAIIIMSVMLGFLAAWLVIKLLRWLADRRARRITLLHARILRRRP